MDHGITEISRVPAPPAPTGSGPNDGGNSRLHILPFFLLPVEWQREYRPLLAEWFVRRHREGVSELDGDRD